MHKMQITFLTQNGEISCTCSKDNTLLEAARGAGGVTPDAPCGGRGICGKCRVYEVTPEGELALTACQTKPHAGARYRIPQWQDLQVLPGGTGMPVKPDPGLCGYGIACDLGTTTVVCRLVNLGTGENTAYLGAGNAQRPYGADVISRIQAASEGNLAALQDAVCGQLSEMICALCEKAGIKSREISCMSVAGNPTMCHLLLGLNPESLGKAPFAPVSRFGDTMDARLLKLPFDGRVYVAPAVSGYVGGDITADILAADLDRAEKPVLLIDVGTNGEMALGCADHFVCCSAAAGPAFEGAQISCGMTASSGAISSVKWENGKLITDTVDHAPPAGVCGSGLIDAVSVMLETGAVDETGRMMDPEEDADDIDAAILPYLFLDEEEHPAFRLSENVFVTQADVRKLQLGKGAMAAGVRVLLQQYGITASGIGQLLLAGGFGNYIRPESAARIGLFPKELLPVTRAVGNAACEGAQAALLSAAARERLRRIQRSMDYYELSGSAAFSEAYMEEMLFPEQA